MEELEEVIDAGLDTFIEVGEALAEIRDSKLYRAEFKTFEKYCSEQWGMSYNRAHQLMTAAETSKILDDPPKVESHARALAPLKHDPEQMNEAWSNALASSGGKPTAKDVMKAVMDIPAPKRTRPVKEPEPVEFVRKVPSVLIPLLHWMGETERFWKMMRGDYLDGVEEHELEELEAGIDVVEKVLNNLKAQLKQYQ